MPGRNMSLGWPAAIGGLGLVACCGMAMAQGAPPPPAVSVTPVASRQVTETSEFLGRVTAINRVDIVARVVGFIEQQNFTEGQKVKAGDLLFRLEQATYKAAVDQQRANLAKAKATQVNTALQLQRGQELVRNQSIPQSTLDQRSADEAAAQADVMRRRRCSNRRRSISATPRFARRSKAGPASPSSPPAIWSVRRPGSCDDRQPRPHLRHLSGERARRARLPAQGRRIRPRTPHVTVHVQLPNGTTYPHPGLTNFLDVEVDTTTDTLAVRAQVPNPEGLLIPGGIVGVTVERGAPTSALVVPQSAVQLDQAGRYVLVVDGAKKVELRRVTTGVEQGRDIVVTDGLKEGELVIVEGIQKVRPGQVVTASVVPGN